MECERCGKPLEGHEDTFGTIDHPLCVECWYAMLEIPHGEEIVARSLFGVVAGLTDTEEYLE